MPGLAQHKGGEHGEWPMGDLWLPLPICETSAGSRCLVCWLSRLWRKALVWLRSLATSMEHLLRKCSSYGAVFMERTEHAACNMQTWAAQQKGIAAAANIACCTRAGW